jgi:hypothetical protein
MSGWWPRNTSADDDGGTDVLVTTRNGARMLEARMRLLRLEGQETERPGYVLTLRDVTPTWPATWNAHTCWRRCSAE